MTTETKTNAVAMPLEQSRAQRAVLIAAIATFALIAILAGGEGGLTKLFAHGHPLMVATAEGGR